MTDILLSVCIPTYNRLSYLKESLEMLLPQTERLGVEVIVSDNCSTDGSAVYLQEMSYNFSSLSYVCQSKNIGLDRNMLTVIGFGRGRYILPLGDDDVIPNGMLQRILDELKDDVDMLLLNGWHTDADLKPKSIHLAEHIPGSLLISPATAFEVLWNKMPFGSFIARRAYFIEKYSSRYIKTSHAYTGAVWDALAEKYETTGICKVKCMSQPTVLLRGGEKSWRNNAAQIMLYEIPRWFSLVKEQDIYKHVVIPIRTAYIKQQIKYITILQYVATEQIDKTLIKLLAQEYSPRQMTRVRIITIIPASVAKLTLQFRNWLVIAFKVLITK